MDVDFTLTAVKLIKANIYIKNDPDCLFITGAADSKVPLGEYEIIGSGSYIKLIEKTSNVKAKIFGKPGAELADLLKQEFNIIDPRKVLMIGDSLRSDIKFGKLAGFQTLAVLTGLTKISDFDKYEEKHLPDFYLNSFGDFKDFL